MSHFVQFRVFIYTQYGHWSQISDWVHDSDSESDWLTPSVSEWLTEWQWANQEVLILVI